MPKLSTQLQSKSRQGTKFPTTTYAYTLSCPQHQKPGILGYTLKLLKIPENSRVSRIFSESALEFCVLIHTLPDRLFLYAFSQRVLTKYVTSVMSLCLYRPGLLCFCVTFRAGSAIGLVLFA